MSPACGCQQSVRLERLLSEAAADSGWHHSGLAEFLSIADVTRRSCDLHHRGDDPVGVGVMRAPHDKAITPERRALHRLTIRSQTLHRQAFETPGE
jgi:hypothetical protein